MPKKTGFLLFLAATGALLVWLTLLSPILLGLANVIIKKSIFRLDYLMPAEFFPVALVGGILLLGSAFAARVRRGLIGWTLAAAVFSLIGGQALAVISGLASGETEPASFWGAVVVASLVIYNLALLGLGIGGIRLANDLSKNKAQAG